MTEQLIKEKILKKYGDKNYKILKFSTCTQPITIQCLECNNIMEIKHLQNLFHPNKKNFCYYCSNTYKGDKTGRKLSLSEANERIEDNFDKEYQIIQNSYDGWAKKCDIKHECGMIFRCQPRDLFYHSHCPCKKIISKGEESIKNFLIKNRIVYEEQKRLPEMKKAPYDFFLPEYNLIIEFQGRQHYEPVEKFGGKEHFIKQKEIDNRKFKLALKKGYDILYISYKDITKIHIILAQRLFLKGSKN